MLLGYNKNLSALLLLAFLSGILVSASIIVPDTIIFNDAIQISKNDTHTIISLSCQARIGDCSFRYNYLPTGWVSDNNRLIFSNQENKKMRSYAAQVNISEVMGDWIYKSLVFDNQYGKFTLKSQTISSSISNASSAHNEKRNSQNSVVQPQTSTDTRYAYLQNDQLPSTSTLTQALQSKSYSVLTMQIQKFVNYPMTLPSFSHPCPLDYYYLLSQGVLPIIDSYTSYYQKQSSLQRTQKAILEQDINRLQEEQKELSTANTTAIEEQINALADEYGDEEGKKNRAFNTYYSSNIIADQYKQRIEEMMLLVSNESKLEMEQLKKSIGRDESRLEEIDILIKELEAERVIIQKRVNYDKEKLQVMEKSNEQQIDQKRLKSLENSYSYYSNQAAINKQIYEKAQARLLEIQAMIQKLRNQAVTKTVEDDSLGEKIQEKKNELEGLKTDERQLATFRQHLALSKNKIENEVMQCEVMIDIPETPQVTTPQASFSGNTQSINIDLQTPDLLAQLHSQYQATPLKNVNIYSSSWIYAYGVPKPALFICSNQVPLNSNSYAYPISSSSSKSVIHGSGQILAITENSFRILLSSGERAVLLFSLCSKISIVSPYEIPKIGDMIEWSGAMSGAGQYRLTQAVIYPTS